MKSKIFCYFLVVSVISLHIASKKAEDNNIMAIETSLDTAIQALEQKPDSDNDNDKRHSSVIEQDGFIDKFFNTFQEINRDFLEYEKMIRVSNSHSSNDTIEKIEGLTDMYYHNAKDFKHMENGKTHGFDFFDEISDMTKQIAITTKALAEIHKNKITQQQISEGIGINHQIASQLEKTKERLNLLKTSTQSVEGEIENVRSGMQKLVDLYGQYLKLYNLSKSSFQKDLDMLNNILAQNENADKDMSILMSLFNKVENFYKNLQSDQVPNQTQMLSHLLAQINTLDQTVSHLKDRVQGQFYKLKNATEGMEKNNLRVTTIRIFNKYIGLVKKIQDLNDQITSIKKLVLSNMKNISNEKFSQIQQILSLKQVQARIQNEKLEHVKTALNFTDKVFKKDSAIKDIRSQMSNYVTEIDEILEKKKHLHEQRMDVIDNFNFIEKTIAQLNTLKEQIQKELLLGRTNIYTKRFDDDIRTVKDSVIRNVNHGQSLLHSGILMHDINQDHKNFSELKNQMIDNTNKVGKLLHFGGILRFIDQQLKEFKKMKELVHSNANQAKTNVLSGLLKSEIEQQQKEFSKIKDKVVDYSNTAKRLLTYGKRLHELDLQHEDFSKLNEKVESITQNAHNVFQRGLLKNEIAQNQQDFSLKKDNIFNTFTQTHNNLRIAKRHMIADKLHHSIAEDQKYSNLKLKI